MPPIHPIPAVGLGTFRLKGEAVQQVVRDAIQIGYRHIDTAAIYQNEKDIGAVLQETYNNPLHTLTRSDFWITSKLSPYDMKKPRESLLQTLRSLQTNYLDLYLIHWPAVARKAASSPEHKRLRLNAWKELNLAKCAGLILHVGVSNFTPQHIQELINETEYGIQGAFVQMEIHPWYWRDALEIQTRFGEKGVIMVGYALLAEGRVLGENCPNVGGSERAPPDRRGSERAPSQLAAAADTPGSSPAGYLLPLDNTYAMSSTDEGEFDYYHKQIMASRDPNYDFFVANNFTS
ncbi:hypothetical protein VE00_10393 [Pseudogymnoascus sp. WSF 3629]|nr:hypothetical protein VE00_10393 [Pseudogymnoascus sp. WSF 3629]